ncbi:hypothetical protein CEB3_c21270 [Peptococcaceae bacterium CEB3]|nr:hypothetical protein CEB3_c21270 [Peptococcaceae bacterium CEB3]
MAGELSSDKIEYYYKKNRFINLLLITHKWRDLLIRKEAAFSIVLAVLSTWLVFVIYMTTATKDFSTFVSNLTLTLGVGLISILGFLVGGLAIIAGTVGSKVLYNINSEKKFDHLMSIIFSFYFGGAVTGVTLVIFIGTYLLVHTPWDISLPGVIVISIIASYFFWFVVVYSIMLLGTLLRLVIMTYRYGYDNTFPDMNEIAKQK